MKPSIPFLCAAALLAAAAGPASLSRAAASPTPQQEHVPLAQTVQLQFGGFAAAGGPIEVAVTVPGRAQVDLAPHLAAGTRGEDVAGLVAERLRALGVSVVGPSPGGGSLFVEGATYVAAKSGGGGLSVSLAACDGRVSALRLRAPGRPDEATSPRAFLSFTSVSPHDGSRRIDRLQAGLDPTQGAPGASAQLQEVGGALGLTGDRPGNDAWRPQRIGGCDVIGLSVQVSGQEGWRIELEL